MVTFKQIDERNYWDAIGIEHGPGQGKFVADGAEIVARAYAYRSCRARCWGIYTDERMVGLALLEDLDEEPACYHLSEFLIDRREQGNGYGQLALELLLKICRLESKYDMVEVCVHKEAAAARHVYGKAGFLDTGYVDEETPESLCLSCTWSAAEQRAYQWKRIGLSEQAAAGMASLLEKASDRLWAAAETAYMGPLPHYPICRLNPAERLAVWGLLAGKAAGVYTCRGIPEEIIWASLSDIGLRVRVYEQEHGRPGLSKEDVIWFRHLVYGELFQLGALQFQPFQMLYLDEEGCGEAYMTFLRKPLKTGSPVLNVHIPAGADLSEDAVTKAFGQAEQFFSAFFPEFHPEAFLCYCWMLYPGLEKLLPGESRIRRFAAQFDVIGTADDPENAVQRIFGNTKDRYAQDTTLQRAAAGRLECLGEACGIRKIPQNS